MKKIDQLRGRLAALSGGEAAPTSSPAEELAACRALKERFRALKLEVLGQLAACRAEAAEKTRRPLGPKPSVRQLGAHRGAAAKRLLRDVGREVRGLLDDQGAAELAQWSAIHREIDAHLGRLARLEGRLAAAAGEGAAALRTTNRPAEDGRDADDELYAAVGAAVQQGQKPGAFCRHCGQGVEPDDRFCRHCGHRRC